MKIGMDTVVIARSRSGTQRNAGDEAITVPRYAARLRRSAYRRRKIAGSS